MATEIVRFISPSLHPDMLKSALHIALQIDENCFKNLSNEEKSKLMLQLSFFFTSPYCYYPPLSSENFELVMSLLVNLTATEDPLFLNSLLKSSDIIKKCMDLILEKGKKKTSTFAIQLFCNISRQFSQELVGKLVLYDSEFCSKLIDYFLIPDCVNKDINNSTTYLGLFKFLRSFSILLGFLVVNLSTVKSFGSLIALNKIESISSLLSSLDGSNSHRLSALRIVYNLSLQDELHVYIFNNNVVFSNNLLVALLSPLVDSEDNLTTEEIEKIPETLQYWEKRRYWDLKLWELTFCILYQFCATRLGRSFLRNANIYPLLREMDNARILKQGEENIKNGIIIEENGKKLDVLRALISILIRKEEEMGIEEKDLDKFESIRQMGI